MGLGHKVCRPADAHEWAALVDVVLPAIELVVTLQGQPQLLLLVHDEQAARLEIRTSGIGDVPELDEDLDGGGL
jgi:hypothetical protein